VTARVACYLIMKKEYKYDIALSFAGEDREYVQRVAQRLKELGIKVFYDNFETTTLWGKDLYQYLSNIYGKEARYTVIFISRNYTRKLWTQHELRQAQSRAFEENIEYILPAKLDDTEIPGLPSTIGYINISNKTPEEFADLIALKVFENIKLDNVIIKEKITKTEHPQKVSSLTSLPLLLYSTRALLTFLINEKYYGQLHFIWAAPFFDISDNSNPRSSSPAHIYNELKTSVLTNDLHSAKIAETKAGLIKGAESQKNNGVISDDVLKEIISIVNSSTIMDFRPIVYVIPTKGIEEKIVETPVSQRANPFSKEYIIEKLHRKYFDVINIDNQNIKL
jgi:hypothetical protein